MGLGWSDIQRMKRVEEKANKLGFIFASGRYTYDPIDSTNSNIVLKPKDGCYPHYNRDAEIFYGSVEEIDRWLCGLEWAREYDEMLRLSNDKKRQDREQTERNQQLMKTIKTGQKVEGPIGAPVNVSLYLDDEDIGSTIDNI